MNALSGWLRAHPRRGALVLMLVLVGIYGALAAREPSEREVAASLAAHLVDTYRTMDAELRRHDPLLAAEVGQTRLTPGSVRCRRTRERSGDGGASWNCSARVRSRSGNLVEMWTVASTKAGCWSGVRVLTKYEDGHTFPGDKLRVNGCVGDRPGG